MTNEGFADFFSGLINKKSTPTQPVQIEKPKKKSIPRLPKVENPFRKYTENYFKSLEQQALSLGWSKVSSHVETTSTPTYNNEIYFQRESTKVGIIISVDNKNSTYSTYNSEYESIDKLEEFPTLKDANTELITLLKEPLSNQEEPSYSFLKRKFDSILSTTKSWGWKPIDIRLQKNKTNKPFQNILLISKADKDLSLIVNTQGENIQYGVKDTFNKEKKFDDFEIAQKYFLKLAQPTEKEKKELNKKSKSTPSGIHQPTVGGKRQEFELNTSPEDDSATKSTSPTSDDGETGVTSTSQEIPLTQSLKQKVKDPSVLAKQFKTVINNAEFNDWKLISNIINNKTKKYKLSFNKDGKEVVFYPHVFDKDNNEYFLIKNDQKNIKLDSIESAYKRLLKILTGKDNIESNTPQRAIYSLIKSETKDDDKFNKSIEKLKKLYNKDKNEYKAMIDNLSNQLYKKPVIKQKIDKDYLSNITILKTVLVNMTKPIPTKPKTKNAKSK